MTVQMTNAQKANFAANGFNYSIIDKSKGDLGNRIECSQKQGLNNLKGAARDTFILGSTVAAGVAVAKNAKVTDTIARFIKKGAVITIQDLKALKLPEKIAAPITKGLKKVVTSKNKAVALATVALLGVSYLITSGKRTAFEAGKIDEKYDNRAKLQKTLEQ